MKTPTRFAELRRARGLTQQQIADAVGVSTVTVYRWERSELKPKADILPKLAKIFGTNIAYMLGETDDPSPVGVTPVSNGTQSGINSYNSNAVFGDTTVTTPPLTVPARPWWLDVLMYAYEMESADDPKTEEAANTIRIALGVLDRTTLARKARAREMSQLVNA